MKSDPTHTVLLHSLEYGAFVTSENDDGTLELEVIAANNGQPFALSRVAKAPADTSAIDPNVPFWVKRAEPKAPEASKK